MGFCLSSMDREGCLESRSRSGPSVRGCVSKPVAASILGRIPLLGLDSASASGVTVREVGARLGARSVPWRYL